MVDADSSRRPWSMRILRKLRARGARIAAGSLLCGTLATLVFRELYSLGAAQNGATHLMMLPLLLILTVFHDPMALFSAVFPISLSLMMLKRRAVGALAGLLAGPVSLLSLSWLGQADLGLQVPSWGHLFLAGGGVVGCLAAAGELSPHWRRLCRQRGSTPESASCYGLAFVCLVWVWASWPSDSEASPEAARAHLPQ